MKDYIAKVFLYASHSTPYIKPLLERGIYVERILDDVHPFATLGDTDIEMKKYLDIAKEVSSIVSIKKNLYNMLARNQKEYESNFVDVPIGKEVDYYNTTDYIVLCFSNFRRSLYKIGDGIYSSVFPKNDFSKYVERRGEEIPVPFPKSFNWKYYVELLAGACLKAYDSNHIILIRTNISEWDLNEQTICMNKASSADMRTAIRSAEDYFVKLTHCNCIEGFLGHYSKSIYSPMPSYAYEMLADDIQDIVRGDKSFSYKSFLHSPSVLIHSIYNRLNNYKLENIKADLKDRSMDVITSIENHFFNNSSNKIFLDLQKLKVFLRDDGKYNLSDYYRDNKNTGIDIRVLELYTEYFKLDMDDLVTVYVILSHSKEKENLELVIENICNNPDCLPFLYINNIVYKNCRYLEGYEYIDVDLKKSLNMIGKVCIARISENTYIQFSLKIPGFAKIIKWKNRMPSVDYILEDDMKCHADEIEMLSSNWPFYIKRARKGKGNTPVKIVFENYSEFLSSLPFLNYEKILESENAIITLNENFETTTAKYKGSYKSKCNLEVILDENTKIFHIGGGLGDQIRHYLYAKIIEKNTGANLVYEDFAGVRGFAGFFKIRLPQVISENSKAFSDKLLSNIISRKLYETYTNSNKKFSDFLVDNGMIDLVSVISHGKFKQDSPCLMIKGTRRVGINAAKADIFKYYYYLDEPEYFVSDVNLIREYISFPKFDDYKNKRIADEMLSCDAVVLHVRCGDMVTVSPHRAPDCGFFRRCIENLIRVTDYVDRKYYIFSDDMNWVRSNSKDIGLDLLEVNNIRFIDYNKNEDSFWDMKLMSLGKVIIATTSGFAHIAGLLGTRKEIFVFQSSWLNDALQYAGWKNKYDIHMRSCFRYKFISRVMVETSEWETETMVYNIVLNDSNHKYYRYDIAKRKGKYSIRIKGISAAFIEFTAGLHDFIDNQSVQYEVYSTGGECWFNFSLMDEIEGLAFCFYPGKIGSTSGNTMKVEEFSVKYKSGILKAE